MPARLQGGSEKMPNLVYLIQDSQAASLGFSGAESRIEKSIFKKYGDQVNIKHFLFDVKAPILEILSETNLKFAQSDTAFSRVTAARTWGASVEWYRTIILGQGIMGDQRGYDPKERKDKLEKMVRVYVGKGEYGHLKNYHTPPYFALTTESTDEVQAAFEAVGVEVRLIVAPPRAENIAAPRIEPETIETKTNAPERPIFDGKQAKAIRKQEGLTQSDLAEVLKDVPSKQTMISNFESGYVRPGFPPQSKFVQNYLRWLKERGYNPYNLK